MLFLCWVSGPPFYCSKVRSRPLTLMKSSDHRFHIGFLRDPLAQSHILEEYGILPARLFEAQSQFGKGSPIIGYPAPHNIHQLARKCFPQR
jgi:hypothetical protein